MTQPSPPSEHPSHGELRARRSTYVISNLGKAGGFYLVVNEQASGHPDYGILIVAGILILGAASVENIVLGAINRFFGKD